MSEITRYAIYRESDGYVENICMWDGESDWTPPAGTAVEKVDDVFCGPGTIRKAPLVYELPIEETPVDETPVDETLDK